MHINIRDDIGIQFALCIPYPSNKANITASSRRQGQLDSAIYRPVPQHRRTPITQSTTQAPQQSHKATTCQQDESAPTKLSVSQQLCQLK